MKTIELQPDETVQIRIVGGGEAQAIINRDNRILELEDMLELCIRVMRTEANTVEYHWDYPRGVENLRSKAKLAEQVLGRTV